MHEHGLARDIWPNMQEIAKENGFKKVTRVDMVFGSLHAVENDLMIHSFADHIFPGTCFASAEVNIQVVDPGDELDIPGQTKGSAATGWELLISRMEGDK